MNSVWGGHSCPPFLGLGLLLIFSELETVKRSKSKSNTNGSGQECPLHTDTEKEKANLISQTGLYLMPATTYSPTHFRVQYHRPSGA